MPMQPSPIADTCKLLPSVRLSMVPPAFVTGCLHFTEAGPPLGCPTLLIQVPADPLTRRWTGLRFVMDTRNEIREFLTSRRAKITPEQAGLRTYGTASRRVPGLRREEVALLAGVSVDYYTRL